MLMLVADISTLLSLVRSNLIASSCRGNIGRLIFYFYARGTWFDHMYQD